MTCHRLFLLLVLGASSLLGMEIPLTYRGSGSRWNTRRLSRTGVQ
jgi:hypothetical protein